MTRTKMERNLEWFLLTKDIYSLIDIAAGGIIWIQGLENWYNIGDIGTYSGKPDSFIKIKKRILVLNDEGLLF